MPQKAPTFYNPAHLSVNWMSDLSKLLDTRTAAVLVSATRGCCWPIKIPAPWQTLWAMGWGAHFTEDRVQKYPEGDWKWGAQEARRIIGTTCYSLKTAWYPEHCPIVWHLSVSSWTSEAPSSRHQTRCTSASLPQILSLRCSRFQLFTPLSPCLQDSPFTAQRVGVPVVFRGKKDLLKLL